MIFETLVLAGMTSLAQPAGYTPPDYDAADTWLCRPGREDACTRGAHSERKRPHACRRLVVLLPAVMITVGTTATPASAKLCR